MPAKSVIAALLFTVYLGACSSTPDPNYYFLDSSAEPVSEYQSGELVGLQEITLPSYALNEKIPTLLGNGRVRLDDDNRWAGAPEEAISANISRHLERALGKRLTTSPFPIGVQPDTQIKIVFDRFIRHAAGRAEIGGQFHVIDDRRRSVLATERFRIDIPTISDDYTGYMRAVDTALDELARKMVASTKAL